MALNKSTRDSTPAHAVRKGTGTRRSGRAAAELIIKSAHTLLARSGPAQFSMRNVAAQANQHLANVQYYFPTRDALINALVQDIARRYRQAYERCVREARAEPVARFEAILAFNFKDIGKRSTRRYFIQLWALLDGLDGNTGRRLNALYELDIAMLSERIAEIDPAAKAPEVRRRATLLAASIEGLMVVQGAHTSDEAEKNCLMKQAQALGFAIALGQVGSRGARVD